MFEKLIEGIILQYFGDYIENLDTNKLQVGVSNYIIIRCINSNNWLVSIYRLRVGVNTFF